MVGVLAALLWAGVALGAPAVTLRAEVDRDLQVIRGVMHVHDLDHARFVDPLASLPIPDEEIPRVRTYPGRPDRGEVTWQRRGDALAFEARLPARYGDTGVTADGLFANGGWYPQPLVDGALPLIRWDVAVEVPPGAVGALGDALGDEVVRWTGTADRASLAVVPRGHVSVLEGDGYRVRLLTRGRPRPGLIRNLQGQLPLAVVSGRQWDGVVVEAPLRRRLSRVGADLAYVSDRAWRVFPWFRRLHHAGALRGMVGAWQGAPDPFVRELAGASFARLFHQRVEAERTADTVGLLRWLPLVDAALYSNEMDYRAELFQEAVPSDRVRDDLAERLTPSTPATLVVAQTADRFGDATADELARLLALGWALPDAAARLGVPPDWFPRWRAPYPEQDYTLRLRRGVATVARQAPPDAVAEVVELDVDGERWLWETPEGPAVAVIAPPEGARRVAVDPERHTDQASRAGDVRPPPMRWTLWLSIPSIDFSPPYISVIGAATIRRAADTHNAFRLWAWTTRRFHLGGRLSWTHYQGPLIRPTIRAHAFSVGVEAGWLNPDFGDIPGADYTVGGTLSYQWDNRRSVVFPRDGASVFVALQAGAAPQTGEEYGRLRVDFEGERAPHPRHVLALRVVSGLALTEIPQERLDLGGGDAIRGLPDQAIQTDLQAALSMEYRPVIGQDLWWSLAGVAWIRDVYLIAGMDLGVALADGQLMAAVGGVAGLGTSLELLGISPGSVNLTFGWPAWFEGFRLPPDQASSLQVRVSWGVSF